MTKKVIILAAGIGKRLYPLTKDMPKCLLEIGEKTLIDYAIRTFQQLGVDKITIVTGHGDNRLREHLNSFNIDYIFNPDYAIKNNIYSLFLARKCLEDGTVIFNSDVLCDPMIIEKVLNTDNRDILVIDDFKKLGKEEMKVRLGENGKIEDIDKRLPVSEADGEYIGIASFSPQGGRFLSRTLEDLIEKGRVGEFYEYAFQRMLSSWDIYKLSTDGLPWIEIDDFDDLKEAKESVLPQIEPKFL